MAKYEEMSIERCCEIKAELVFEARKGVLLIKSHKEEKP